MEEDKGSDPLQNNYGVAKGAGQTRLIEKIEF
jgi:hypothetical protein